MHVRHFVCYIPTENVKDKIKNPSSITKEKHLNQVNSWHFWILSWIWTLGPSWAAARKQAAGPVWTLIRMLGWSRMVNRAGPATESQPGLLFPSGDGGGGPAAKAEQGRRWPLHPAQRSWSNPGDPAFCPHSALPSATWLWRQSCWWTVRPTQMLVSWAHTRWTRDAV